MNFTIGIAVIVFVFVVLPIAGGIFTIVSDRKHNKIIAEQRAAYEAHVAAREARDVIEQAERKAKHDTVMNELLDNIKMIGITAEIITGGELTEEETVIYQRWMAANNAFTDEQKARLVRGVRTVIDSSIEIEYKPELDFLGNHKTYGNFQD